MKISCPSCSSDYDTKDYPGAFEIPCTCGYSILLPSDTGISSLESAGKQSEPDSPSEEVNEVNFEFEPVSSQEEEDAPLSLGSEFAQEQENPQEPSITPPENLPENMTYDPFELKEGDPDPAVNTAPLERNHPESTRTIENEAETPRESIQKVIDRTQTASMGQFLGIEIDLEIEGLEKNQRIEMLHQCEALLRDRPWLELELQNRKIRLEQIVEDSKIKRIPEFLAVQIYLSAFELGGRCKFSPRLENSFQSHPA